MGKAYETTQPERSAIDALPGTVALEFGTGWCGHCRAAEQHIAVGAVGQPGKSSTSKSKMVPAARLGVRSASSCGRPSSCSGTARNWRAWCARLDANEVRQALEQAAKE